MFQHLASESRAISFGEMEFVVFVSVATPPAGVLPGGVNSGRMQNKRRNAIGMP